MDTDNLKRHAAEAALELVDADMTIGVGTGSTAAFFIEGLSRRFAAAASPACVPTSEATRKALIEAGLLVVEPDEVTQIDLAVDGADEIGPELALIKGGGGAMMREKIVAQAARRFVVIADGAKRVARLGAFPLPIEIEPALFALTVAMVQRTLSDIGFAEARLLLRAGPSGKGPYLTDGRRYVLDASLGRIDDPARVDVALRAIAGVTETGLFVGLADDVFLATGGGVEHLTH